MGESGKVGAQAGVVSSEEILNKHGVEDAPEDGQPLDKDEDSEVALLLEGIDIKLAGVYDEVKALRERYRQYGRSFSLVLTKLDEARFWLYYDDEQ